MPGVTPCLGLIWVLVWVALAGAIERPLIIGVGRDFFEGPDSRTYLHGSTNTWEALTYLGEGLNAEPWLAESWYSAEDGRTWTFRLRKGVVFHDGSPLTAQVAKASIDRIVARPKYDPSGIYRDLLRLEANDPLELVFHLKQPLPDFPNRIAYYSSPILHPKDFDANGRLRGLTATGPFRIRDIKAGQAITLESFSQYWGSKPAYERVVFRAILDATSRLMSLMAGEVNAIADVGGILPQQAAVIQKNTSITLKQVEVATTHYLLFNCRKPPFDAPAARRWAAGLIDREAMVASLVHGAGRVALDPFSPLAQAWAFGNLRLDSTPKPALPEIDLVILLHAGTLERWPYRDMAQIIQAQLSAAGLTIVIRVREAGAFYEDLQQGRFHMALQPNTLMTGEPDFFYSYHVASRGHRNNGCGTPEMDALIDLGRHTMDPVQRRDIYQRLAGLFARQLPLLPLYHDVSLYAHGPQVADFYMDHHFRPLLLKARPHPR